MEAPETIIRMITMHFKKCFMPHNSVLILTVSGLAACNNVLATPPENSIIQTPNGVVVGDVRSDSAVLWSRTDRDAEMQVNLQGKHDGSSEYKIAVDGSSDYTGRIKLQGLDADTLYHYSVVFKSKNGGDKQKSTILTGSFRTAPKPDDDNAVSFAWGGDLAGQNVCRDVNKGFPVFDAINQQQWDFFIGLGDMIYADGVCEAIGGFGNQQIIGNFIPSANLDNYWAHWSYNREDGGFQQLLSGTPYIAIWDDHEVANDFGLLHDTRETAPYTSGEHLLPIGLQAFLDYNPIAISPDTPNRLYRNIRWGQHIELFVLDTRQYRDANFMPDNEDAPKSMLGREQLTWLKQKLAASDATWKVIVSSVPMSIPTGFPPENGRDGWANFDQDTGFEYELTAILRYLQQQGSKNIVWLTTDVHFSEGFIYQPFADAPDFAVYEFVSGPLNAGVFPNEDFDSSLNPSRLFFHGAPVGLDYDGALEYLTFGTVEVSEQGDMTVKIINASGNVVAEQFLPRQ